MPNFERLLQSVPVLPSPQKGVLQLIDSSPSVCSRLYSIDNYPKLWSIYFLSSKNFHNKGFIKKKQRYWDVIKELMDFWFQLMSMRHIKYCIPSILYCSGYLWIDHYKSTVDKSMSIVSCINCLKMRTKLLHYLNRIE